MIYHFKLPKRSRAFVSREFADTITMRELSRMGRVEMNEKKRILNVVTSEPAEPNGLSQILKYLTGVYGARVNIQ